MPFIPLEDTVQVELRSTYTSQNVEYVFYVQRDGGWSDGAMNDLAAVFVAWISDDLRPLHSSAWSFNSVVVTDMGTDHGSQIVYTGGLPLTGSVSAGTPLPSECAFAVKHSTANRGRSYRGRTYLGGITTGQMATSNELSTDYADAAVSAFDDLIDVIAVLSSEPHWVVASRYHNNAPRTAGVMTNITGNSYTDLLIDSRKSRKPGVGI